MHLEPIETQRLAIRQFRPDDWKAIYEYMSDLEVIAYLPEGQLTEAQTREFLAKNIDEHAEALAVTLKVEKALIGHMLFHPWFAPQIYEIGWVFNKGYHGQGYATEAAYALLEYGFETLQIHRVIATCQRENVPSYRVMEKLGMQREDHLRKCIDRGENQSGDEYLYTLLEEEWFQGKLESVAQPSELKR
jgi:ribosomal-protein-alanine N-acetyltransferase